MTSTARPDVIVVGAGAAGIGAGRELAEHGVPHLILESRDRVGGRAWTVDRGGPYPLDFGCEWLHSADRNVLATLAPGLGFALDKSEPPWRRRNSQIGFDLADHDDFAREQDAFYARLQEAARDASHDRPASDFLDPGARWNGLIDAISTYYNGASLDRVSVVDFDRYVDTEVNWRVPRGLGTLVAALAKRLPIQLGRRVTRIALAGAGVCVETDSGAIEAEKAIVTVPSNVLASGAIRFDPPFQDHMAAAAGLPLGLADKLWLTLAEPDAVAPDSRLIGRPGHVDSGAYTLRPRGSNVIEGYFGGDYAKSLERGGLAAFADAARREISAGLGRDIGDKLKPIAATAWAVDPFAQGSYSHALPGHAEARGVLATPVEDRLFFAGEATSPHFFSTVHGAFEEGARAARASIVAGRAAAAGGRR